jgi:hypothetical protein
MSRRPRSGAARPAILALLALLAAGPVAAQTIEDGMFMPRRLFCTGVVYTHDSWERYWEGTLERANGNIGTVTTQSVAYMGTYGVTDRLNVIASLPYVWTNASEGVLAGMDGVQDVTLGVKYNLLQTGFTDAGELRTIVVASAAAPATDYVADFLPMSIGLGSRRVSGRVTLDFRAKQGWFVNGSGAYTWRDNVSLDRVAYFTSGRLHHSDEVAMPDVFDYTLSAGYRRGVRWHVPISFTRQYTRGGADIRRQDMPFVSDRMNFTRVDGAVMYWLPGPSLGFKVGAARVLDGRNVGKSTSLSAGLLYTFEF